MFLRLALVILVAAGLLGVILSARAQQLQLASELAQARLRIRDADEKLWRLRGVIADRVTPGQVRILAASSGIGPLAPATNDLSPRLAQLFPNMIPPRTPTATPVRTPPRVLPLSSPSPPVRPSRYAHGPEEPRSPR